MAATLDITVEQGATLSKVITWVDETNTPLNLGGYSARFQIKSLSTPITMLDLSTSAGTIRITGSTGTIVLTAPPAMTSLVTQQGKYELLVTSPKAITTRILEGKAFLSKGVITG